MLTEPQASTSNASQLRPERNEDGEKLEQREEVIICSKFYKQQRTLVAARIRRGATGYREWMNELQVYLLPNFSHQNVLQLYGFDANDDQDEITEEDGLVKKVGSCIKKTTCPEHQRRRSRKMQLEYWIMTKFCDDSRTMRDYLTVNTVTWEEMLKISKGIMSGLYFLHENHEFMNGDSQSAIKGYLRGTNGKLKGVYFQSREDDTKIVHLTPYVRLSVVHRNLSSTNIVLKRDLTPCIWNFGTSFIHYPFQPVNQPQLVPFELRDPLLISRYSPPEVLLGNGYFTLSTLKAIDMYASGILLWELLLRCKLLTLQGLISEVEHLERSQPESYYEPFADQLGPNPNQDKLEYLVCRARARPRIKRGWLIGKRSNKYVKIIRDLWDHDSDARIQAATALDRLSSFEDPQYESLYRGKILLGKWVNLAEKWGYIDTHHCFQVPIPIHVDSNIRFMDLDTEQMEQEVSEVNNDKKVFSKMLKLLRLRRKSRS